MILQGNEDLFSKTSVHGTEVLVSKNEDLNFW